MKGKSIFTLEEAKQIKIKLDECANAGRYNDMRFRVSLTSKYRFFISDFEKSRKGFSSSDFDHHVSIGNIKIEDEQSAISILANKFVNFDYESDQVQDRFQELTQRVKSHESSCEDYTRLLFALLNDVKNRIPGMIVN